MKLGSRELGGEPIGELMGEEEPVERAGLTCVPHMAHMDVVVVCEVMALLSGWRDGAAPRQSQRASSLVAEGQGSGLV